MGFKKTSDLIAVSFKIDESAANTLTTSEIALQLDVLNNEIAVIIAVDLNVGSPEMIAATNTSVRAALSATLPTTFPQLSDSNTIAVAQEAIRSDAVQAVGFQRNAAETFTGDLDYLAIVATNNMFSAIQGAGNTSAKAATGRVWLYRARADASTYAALVQSEVLSA